MCGSAFRVRGPPSRRDQGVEARTAGLRRRRLTPVPAASLQSSVAELWLAGYPNPRTRQLYESRIRSLVTHAQVEAAELSTEAQVISWATQPSSNTKSRGRITVALSFFGWCAEQGYPSPDLSRLQRIKRQYPRLYGKTQAANPGRWLTHDQAFGSLVPACHDGTEIGLRDELVIRFGLAGMRKAEIVTLTWRNLATVPTVEWTGKGNRTRRITIGPTFVHALELWRNAYPDPHPDAPVICRAAGTNRPRVDWGHGYGDNTTCIHRIVTQRAQQAGLGHVAPHDLRRTAAGILHTTTDHSGAHHFDLLDIQKVLGHADPATTMRSYLDPMDTGVYERAGAVLD